VLFAANHLPTSLLRKHWRAKAPACGARRPASDWNPRRARFPSPEGGGTPLATGVNPWTPAALNARQPPQGGDRFLRRVSPPCGGSNSIVSMGLASHRLTPVARGASPLRGSSRETTLGCHGRAGFAARALCGTSCELYTASPCIKTLAGQSSRQWHLASEERDPTANRLPFPVSKKALPRSGYQDEAL
jgi:hypothetical protein